MTSNKPYLLRAFYDWIIDNQLTPYLVIDAEMPDVIVPREYIEDGRIVLDISPSAVQALSMTNQSVAFEASFSGVAMQVSAHIKAVLAIYAKENGMGMVFGDENEGDDDTPPPKPPGKKGKPHLKVVK